MFTYSDCRKVEPTLPELYLSIDVIDVMMKDREDTKFRMNLMGLLLEVKSNNRAKVLSLIKFINSYIEDHKLKDLYRVQQKHLAWLIIY